MKGGRPFDGEMEKGKRPQFELKSGMPGEQRTPDFRHHPHPMTGLTVRGRHRSIYNLRWLDFLQPSCWRS